MRGLFDAVKADLLDRRLRVLVLIVVGVFVAAVGYVAMSGGSQSATPTASTGPLPTGAAATPPTAKASTSNTNGAAAESTFGSAYQHHSQLKDPFVLLRTTTSTTSSAHSSSKSSSSSSGGSAGKSTTTAAVSGSNGSSGSGSSGSSGSGSSGSSGGSTVSTPKQAPAPPKPKTVVEYRANVELGPAPAAGETAHLTAYDHVKTGQQLPSKTHPLVVLTAASLDATKGNASGTFELISSPIVTGPGKCLPNDTQCESIKLTPGQVEELQYEEANGQTVTYQLRVVSVVKKTHTTG
jgi:hypothetical protein